MSNHISAVIATAADEIRNAWLEYYDAPKGRKPPSLLGVFQRVAPRVGVRFEAKLLEELLRAEIECRHAAGDKPRVSDYNKVAAQLAELTDRKRIIREAIEGPASVSDRDALAALARQPHWNRSVQGKYELIEFISSGGMGVVWLARRLTDGFHVAIKFAKEFGNGFEKSIQLETELHINLIPHRNVLRVIDAAFDIDGPYVVTEYVESRKTLRHLIGGDPPPLIDALRIIKQIADGLAFLHGGFEPVYHRDLKPENVLMHQVNPQQPLSCSTPKLTDFGLSVIGDDQRSHPRAGTPMYRSPSVLDGEVDAWASPDIWALGVILYEIMTGRKPFASEKQIRNRERARLLGEALPGLRQVVGHGAAQELQRMIDTCLFPNSPVSGQYSSALHFANDVENLIDGIGLITHDDVLLAASVPLVPIDRAAIELAAPMVGRILTVKTLVHQEQEVPISKFYFPSRVIDPSGQILVVDSIEDFGEGKPVVVQAVAGQGKSIFFRHLAGRVFDSRQAIPLYIEFRRLGALSLMSAIRQQLESLGINMTPEGIESAIGQGLVVLLFDAFDELPDESVGRVATELRRLTDSFPNARLYISTRPHSTLTSVEWARVFGLAELGPADVPFVIRKYAGPDEAEQIVARMNQVEIKIAGVLTSPLMVVLLVIHFRYALSLPTSVVEFYKDLFDVLFRRHNISESGLKRRPKSNLEAHQLRRFFEGLCFIVRRDKDDDDIHKSDLENLGLKAARLAELRCNVSNALDDITRISNLIVEEAGYSRFIHRSVKEYYSAAFLSKETDQHVAAFYASVLSKWRSWQTELQFLSLIDEFRFAKYFAIPDIESLGRIDAASVISNHRACDMWASDRRHLTLKLAEPRAYCLRDQSFSLKNHPAEPMLRELGPSIRSRLPDSIEHIKSVQVEIQDADVDGFVRAFTSQSKSSGEFASDGDRRTLFTNARTSLNQRLKTLQEFVATKSQRTSDFHV